MKKILIIFLLIVSIKGYSQTQDINGDLTYHLSHCDMYLTGGTYTLNIGAGASGRLLPSMSVKEADYITCAGDTIVITVAGDYMVYFSFSGASTDKKDFKIIPRTVTSGGAPTPVTDASLYFSGFAVDNFTSSHWSWYLAGLTVGESISFWITNVTDATDFTFKEIQVLVIKMAEKI